MQTKLAESAKPKWTPSQFKGVSKRYGSLMEFDVPYDVEEHAAKLFPWKKEDLTPLEFTEKYGPFDTPLSLPKGTRITHTRRTGKGYEIKYERTDKFAEYLEQKKAQEGYEKTFEYHQKLKEYWANYTKIGTSWQKLEGGESRYWVTPEEFQKYYELDTTLPASAKIVAARKTDMGVKLQYYTPRGPPKTVTDWFGRAIISTDVPISGGPVGGVLGIGAIHSTILMGEATVGEFEEHILKKPTIRSELMTLEQLTVSYGLIVGTVLGLKFGPKIISEVRARLPTWFPGSTQHLELGPSTIGSVGEPVETYVSKPLSKLGGKGIRVVADVTENPIGALNDSLDDLIRQYTDKTYPTGHATLSPERFDLTKGGRTLLQGFPEEGVGYRSAKQLYHFYSAPGSKDYVTVYGGYIGIGSGYDEAAKIVVGGQPTALVTLNTKISSAFLKTVGESVDDYLARISTLSGQTGIAPETILRKSAERQFITPASYERFGQQLPGSLFVSQGKVGTFQIKELPKGLLGKIPVIRTLASKYTHITVVKGAYAPVEGFAPQIAKVLDVATYAETYGRIRSVPVTSVGSGAIFSQILRMTVGTSSIRSHVSSVSKSVGVSRILSLSRLSKSVSQIVSKPSKSIISQPSKVSKSISQIVSRPSSSLVSKPSELVSYLSTTSRLQQPSLSISKTIFKPSISLVSQPSQPVSYLSITSRPQQPPTSPPVTPPYTSLEITGLQRRSKRGPRFGAWFYRRHPIAKAQTIANLVTGRPRRRAKRKTGLQGFNQIRRVMRGSARRRPRKRRSLEDLARKLRRVI